MKTKNRLGIALALSMALAMGSAVVAPVVSQTVDSHAIGEAVFGESAKASSTHYLYEYKSGKMVKVGTISKGSAYTVGYTYKSGYYQIRYYYGSTFYMTSSDVYKDL